MGILVVLCAAPAAAAEEESYGFLLRQGALLSEYERLDEATDVLIRACATTEGGRSAECLSRLAHAAEGARRIGVAVAALERGVRLPGPGAEVARAELQRLRETWGSVRFEAPADRRWPSLPLNLRREAPILDPALKRHAAVLVEQVAKSGLDGGPLWLPAGAWALDGRPLVVEAGKEVRVPVRARWLPWVPRAFRLGNAPEPGSLGGPWAFGARWELVWSHVPGESVGQGPLASGAHISLGRSFGPLRVELGAHLGLGGVESGKGAPERQEPRIEALVDLDVGLLLQVHPRAWLVPHVALLGGLAGETLLPCVAEAPDRSLRGGECRVRSRGLGGLGGLEVQVAPGAQGVVLLRLGLAAGGLDVRPSMAPGAAVGGEVPSVLIRASRWNWGLFRAAFELGVDVRF